MKIAQIITMDIGQTGIACEGNIFWTQPPKNIVSPPDYAGEPYDFWTQFVILQDDTGKIGVSVNVEAGQTLAKGQHIKIEKARLKEYNKKLSLERAKLAQPVVNQPPQQQGKPLPAPTGSQTTEMGDMVKVRSMAYSYAKDIAIAELQQKARINIKPLSLIDDAIGITAFIATGIMPKKVADKQGLNAAEQAGEQIEYHEEPPSADEADEAPPF